MYPAQLLRVVNACDQQPHKYAPVNRVRLVLRAATMAGICVPSVAFTRGPSETAMLAGSPAGRIGRLYRLTITATNGVAPAARQAFTLTVHQARPSCRPGDRCSEIRPTQPFPRRQQGISCPCARQTGRLPHGFTFRTHGNGTAALTGDPVASQVGRRRAIKIIASNGTGRTVTQALTIVIRQRSAGCHHGHEPPRSTHRAPESLPRCHEAAWKVSLSS